MSSSIAQFTHLTGVKIHVSEYSNGNTESLKRVSISNGMYVLHI